MENTKKIQKEYFDQARKIWKIFQELLNKYHDGLYDYHLKSKLSYNEYLAYEQASVGDEIIYKDNGQEMSNQELDEYYITSIAENLQQQAQEWNNFLQAEKAAAKQLAEKKKQVKKGLIK